MYSDIEGSNLGERWLYNENHKIRDQDIKEAFKKTETKMEHKSRIDAMFSGEQISEDFRSKVLPSLKHEFTIKLQLFKNNSNQSILQC